MKTIKEYARQIVETVTNNEEHLNYRVSIAYKQLGEPIDRFTENDKLMLASDLLRNFDYQYGSDLDVFWETMLTKLNKG